jgi:uncharacterized iron-regulated membrane protein
MSHHDDHLHDADFGPVIDRLQSERPTASALELDLIKQRVRGRVARNARRSRRTEFMRSRLAILGMLVLGMVLSTGGAGLAVSGFASQNGNAAQTQYGVTTPPPSTTPTSGKPGGGVLGEEESGSPAGGQNQNNGGSPTGGGNETQPSRQVESGAQGNGGEQLPFTGFAAIPILLGGVALLGTGLVLRRRTADDN